MKVNHRLLRKPRAPEPTPDPVLTQTPHSCTNELNQELAYYFNARSGDLSRVSAIDQIHNSELSASSESWANRSVRGTLNRNDLRYVLDRNFRGRTALGTYVEGNSLVKPFKPRGPDALPARVPRQNPPIINVFYDEDMARYYPPPKFCLQDFLVRMSERENTSLEIVKSVMLSRHNYKKLQQLVMQQYQQQQETINTVEIRFPGDVPISLPRVPEKQFLLELTALYKEQLRLTQNVRSDSIRATIRALPKYNPDYKPGVPAPHTEIVVYEDQEAEERKLQKELREDTDVELPVKENLFYSAASKYFQGIARSTSPYTVGEEGVISPSELAVLDSLMAGGKALSLKAHFLSQLPDIACLAKTITYLNLSFNYFRFIPSEVFEIEQLTVLKLRNNPLTEIHPDIARLKNLRSLVFSFCLVDNLPLSLFTLRKLEDLNFAYNKISFVPDEIRRLKKLRVLNMEGNELCAMPVGALRLRHVKHLNVKNTFMHPLLWEENSRNQPQRLTDLAALCFKQNNLDSIFTSLPDDVAHVIDNHSRCDCCHGPLYGMGLRIIRPVSKMFGIRNLPFLFHCCSPYCLQLLVNNSATLINMLYGEPQKDE